MQRVQWTMPCAMTPPYLFHPSFVFALCLLHVHENNFEWQLSAKAHWLGNLGTRHSNYQLHSATNCGPCSLALRGVGPVDHLHKNARSSGIGCKLWSEKGEQPSMHLRRFRKLSQAGLKMLEGGDTLYDSVTVWHCINWDAYPKAL